VAIKKGSEARVKELLTFCDFIASPFGTEEQFLLSFGIEGTHFKREGSSDPVRLPAADTGSPPGIGYIGAQASAVLYSPNSKEMVQKQHDYHKQVLPSGVQDPTIGLYSEAFVTTGATAAAAMNDLQRAIVIGRKPLSEWDSGVDRWRRETGDQQRKEYQDALQQK